MAELMICVVLLVLCNSYCGCHWDHCTNVSSCMYVYILILQPGCKKVRGQSEATMGINDQKL